MNDEVIVLKKSDLKSVLSETIRNELADKLSAFETLVKKLVTKKDLPDLIAGDKRAGEIVGVSGQAMQKRRNSGVYREGIDFIKKSGRILYRTDALLDLKE